MAVAILVLSLKHTLTPLVRTQVDSAGNAVITIRCAPTLNTTELIRVLFGREAKLSAVAEQTIRALDVGNAVVGVAFAWGRAAEAIVLHRGLAFTTTDDDQ